jgi:hypothetical protein
MHRKHLIRYTKLNKKSGLSLPLIVSLLFLSGCSSSQSKDDSSGERFGKPNASMGQPAPQMQPLQPGQPPQKPARSISTMPAVMGGQPGTHLPFNQPFRLADKEYQFMAAKGKNYVGLDSNPAMKPSPGYSYFLVRYQVINHGGGTVTVPNAAAVHLFNLANQQVTDIDPAATNANVQSGAATGMPDQLMLEPERPQIQTLAFQLPTSTDVSQFAVLVTEPRDPRRVFQIVNLSN